MVSFPGTDTNNLVNNSVHPPLLPRREDAGAVSLCVGVAVMMIKTSEYRLNKSHS